jgi:hypothetical protein
MKTSKNLIIALLIGSQLACENKKGLEITEYDLNIVLAETIVDKTIPTEITDLCLPIEFGDSILLHANKEAKSPVLTRIDDRANQSLYVNTDDWLGSFFGAGNIRMASDIEDGLKSMTLNREFGQKYTVNDRGKANLDSLILAVEKRNGLALIFAKKSPARLYKNIRVLSTTDSIRIVLAQAVVNQGIKNVTIIYGVEADLLSESPPKKASIVLPDSSAVNRPPSNPDISTATPAPDKVVYKKPSGSKKKVPRRDTQPPKINPQATDKKSTPTVASSKINKSALDDAREGDAGKIKQGELNSVND